MKKFILRVYPGAIPMTDTQVYIALALALIPGFLALRLSTELYK
jgi:photosystem I subunit XII